MYIASGQSKLRVLTATGKEAWAGMLLPGEREAVAEMDAPELWFWLLAEGGGDAGDGDCCCRRGPLPLLRSHASSSPAVAEATTL